MQFPINNMFLFYNVYHIKHSNILMNIQRRKKTRKRVLDQSSGSDDDQSIVPGRSRRRLNFHPPPDSSMIFSPFHSHFVGVNVRSTDELIVIARNEKERVMKWTDDVCKLNHPKLSRAIPDMSQVLGSNKWTPSLVGSLTPEQCVRTYIEFLDFFLSEQDLNNNGESTPMNPRKTRDDMFSPFHSHFAGVETLDMTRLIDIVLQERFVVINWTDEDRVRHHIDLMHALPDMS